MRRLSVLLILALVPASALASQTVATDDTYHVEAFFTSGIDEGLPVDRIETATLDQEYVVLYVDWDEMQVRAYRTEVEIVDPDGEVIGKIRVNIVPRHGRHYTYYYFRPNTADKPGDWTYRMYVDGRSAFEAKIPILAAE